MTLRQFIADKKNERMQVRLSSDWCSERQFSKEETKKALHDIRKVFRYKLKVNRMVEDLTFDCNPKLNSAVPLLASLLNSVMIITSSEDSDHSFKAVKALNEICFNIINESGSASDQFSIMLMEAATSPYDISEDENKE